MDKKEEKRVRVVRPFSYGDYFSSVSEKEAKREALLWNILTIVFIIILAIPFIVLGIRIYLKW